MIRPIGFHLVLLALALGLLSACADDSGEWVEWYGQDVEIYLPAGYERGQIGNDMRMQPHPEYGPAYAWVQVVEAKTGAVVGSVVCAQFGNCLGSPVTYRLADSPAHVQVMRQIAGSVRGVSDNCDPREEPCEGE